MENVLLVGYRQRIPSPTGAMEKDFPSEEVIPHSGQVRGRKYLGSTEYGEQLSDKLYA